MEEQDAGEARIGGQGRGAKEEEAKDKEVMEEEDEKAEAEDCWAVPPMN